MIEKRDNPAGALVGPTDGISDLNKFLNYYKLDVSDLREHFEGDEDQDWEDGEDLNNDGIYQSNENPGNDVGLDGVGPLDLTILVQIKEREIINLTILSL